MRMDDLVSDLPDEIVKHIISFLPLKEAVRSGTLSTTWRQLMAPVCVDTRDTREALGAFLRSCICPETLKISKAGEFVVLATKGVEKELHLNFLESSDRFGLRLATQSLDDSFFSCLKTLHIRSLNLGAGSLISEVFAGCDRLQSLRFERCSGLEDLHVGSAKCLRSLVVLDCPHIATLVVSAPKLGSFWYRGVLPRMLQLDGALELVDATLDFGFGHNHFDCDQLLSLLSSLKEVGTLTLSAWLLEWMCTAGVIFGRLEFGFNSIKELNLVTSSSLDRSRRDSFACFFNMCPMLESLNIEMREGLDSDPCPFIHHHWHEPHLWMDFEMVIQNTRPLKHLKRLNISGFIGEEDQVLLVDLLLNKAIFLDSMTII